MKLNPNNETDLQNALHHFKAKRSKLKNSPDYGGIYMDLSILLLDEQLEKIKRRAK
ncbi:MAG: hypothetical protein RSD63_10255 [Eubacterium sp.]